MMKNKICKFFLILLFFSILPYCIFASNEVIINEFSIDPQPQQVEILNTSSQSADISNWYLDDNGGSSYVTFPKQTILNPNACYVFSGDINLNKSSPDTIRLFSSTYPPTSSSAQLVDSYAYIPNITSGQSFIRFPDGDNNWIASSSSIGKFNLSNQSCVFIPTSTPIPTLLPTPSNTPIPTIEQLHYETITNTPTTPPINHIYISEVMIHPNPNENEWIELFNNNKDTISLQNWYIDDYENKGSTPKKISIQISPKSYFTFDIKNALFNNAGDQVRLLDEYQNEIDSFEYSSSSENITYGRIDFISSEFCSQNPSKNSANTECIDTKLINQSKPTQQNLPTNISTITPSFQNKQTKTINSKSSSKQLTKKITPFLQNLENSFDQNVLGMTTSASHSIHLSQNTLLCQYFSSLSLIYSILTIFFICIKMKKVYEYYH